jgi:hypothetical protein
MPMVWRLVARDPDSTGNTISREFRSTSLPIMLCMARDDPEGWRIPWLDDLPPRYSKTNKTFAPALGVPACPPEPFMFW